MPSKLRFREPYRTGERETAPNGVPYPRTPKSPYGVYTGSPISPAKSTTTNRLPLKILFGILATAALLLFGLFHYREKLIPESPTRSSIYWITRSAGHANAVKARQSMNIPQEEIQAVFTDQYAFQLPGPGGDRAWSNMFPKSDGRVSVQNPRRYGLPESVGAVDGNGLPVPATEVYSVAVIKQLECLAFLRQILIEYDHEMHPHVHERSRAFHCLDHVRQAVLCTSDTTLEPTSDGGVSDPSSESSDFSNYANPAKHYSSSQNRPSSQQDDKAKGFEPALHTCRNWTAVKMWIEDHRV